MSERREMLVPDSAFRMSRHHYEMTGMMTPVIVDEWIVVLPVYYSMKSDSWMCLVEKRAVPRQYDASKLKRYRTYKNPK